MAQRKNRGIGGIAVNFPEMKGGPEKPSNNRPLENVAS